VPFTGQSTGLIGDILPARDIVRRLTSAETKPPGIIGWLTALADARVRPSAAYATRPTDTASCRLANTAQRGATSEMCQEISSRIRPVMMCGMKSKKPGRWL
jgi:hypothetical protein